MRKRQWIRRGLFAAAVLGLADLATLSAMSPAGAQFFGDRNAPRPAPSGGFFDQLFGPSIRPRTYQEEPAAPPPQIDYSRAPPTPQRKPDAPAPTTSVVVLGDSMADWLASGLDDAFADAPEVAIVRKARPFSGLLRYDPRTDQDWWHVARDILAAEKPNYVVMMIGIGDRQNIREADIIKERAAEREKREAERKAAEKKDGDKKEGDKSDAAKNTAADDAKTAASDGEDAGIIAPEPQGRSANGIIEFRTERWAAIYGKRIADTTAALRSRGVPVFWVGLPSIRGPKSTADAVYLNELFRARAERAGAIYIDVWDGFVDERGNFTYYGPDFEGQRRALRSGDGVYFTKFGARKLAHYVERELRRYMRNPVPVALPVGPGGQMPVDGKSERPLAGPVVPLTATQVGSDELLGGGASAPLVDAIATRVLVKGETVAAPKGRADDFALAPGATLPSGVMMPSAPAAPPVASTPETPAPASSAAVAPPTSYTEPPVAAPKPAPKPPQTAETRPRPAAASAPVQRAPQPPPQPQPQPTRPGLFDFLR